ncbi:MAG TPA: hypothetical protein VFX16_05905 [Pseudonocardiaceae bacterium]|nr:hypothetical protein [Pseudonocardiaceae bacterium]
MSAQPPAPAADTRRRGSFARPALALVTGALAITVVAACGSSTPTAAAPPTTHAAARPNPGTRTPPGAFGTAAAVGKTSLEVQNQQTGQVTVKFTSSTVFTNTIKASLADIKVGMCATVTATSGGAQAKALTARTVGISAATSSGCTAAGAFGGAGGFGGGGNFGRGDGGNGSRTPDPSRRVRPSGANGAGGAGGAGNFGRAFGSVTAVSPTGFTVKGVVRGSNPAVTTTVTVTTATTYTESAKATSHALAVGDCIVALGASDDTGAVSAKTINISKAGSNGCAGGFGRGGGGFRGNGNGGGEAGSTPSLVPGGGNG